MKNALIKSFHVDSMRIKVYKTRKAMGQNVALEFAEKMKEINRRKDFIRMIFAAAPSQSDFLNSLVELQDLPWSKSIAFHMDEYLDLEKDHPALFRIFLNEHIFSKVPFKEVHYIDTSLKIEESLRSYEKKLKKDEIDMVALGIGENGHIAFNDPPVADFEDPEVIKVVELDDKCRQQQVHDGAFPSLEKVPRKAISLTIPTMMNANSLFCIVPGPLKKEAVKKTLEGPITTECPASILRTHPDATLYLDEDSASMVI